MRGNAAAILKKSRGNRKCENAPGRVDRVLALQPACNLNVASLILKFPSEVNDVRFYPAGPNICPRVLAAEGLPVSVLGHKVLLAVLCSALRDRKLTTEV